MEEWKTVVYNDEVFEDYEVSTKGNVRSLNYMKTGKTKNITFHKDKQGYLFVELWKDKKLYICKVHRTVAYTFIPNPNNYDTVDHIDRNVQNNCVENLRWLPKKDNIPKGKRIKCVETGQEFDSIAQTSREMNLQASGISRVLSGFIKQTGGYTFVYID